MMPVDLAQAELAVLARLMEPQVIVLSMTQ